MFLPWNIKRFLLIKFWKYKIHKSAYIGLSYIYPKHLIMVFRISKQPKITRNIQA